jgi:hypothetical protein
MRDASWTSGLFRRRRKAKPAPGDFQIDFSAGLRVFPDDGWVYLELLLVNRSNVSVWVEEAVIVLSELEANWQTSVSTGPARHEILENIRPNDTLRVSLVGDIYEAAGKPQGMYSCTVFTDVRYRVGDEWFNKSLEGYKVEMAALTVFRLRSSRWFGKKIRASVPADDLKRLHREEKA